MAATDIRVRRLDGTPDEDAGIYPLKRTGSDESIATLVGCDEGKESGECTIKYCHSVDQKLAGELF